MIKLKSLTLRNFISVGNITQTLDLDREGLSLVLGENIDQGNSSSRNGAGKTTIINGISYALYGTAITNIRKDNLINKTNQKNMLVTLTFEKGNNKYKIERGRKPNLLKFYVNDGLVSEPDANESQGENKHTQEEIEKVLNLSPTLFKHIVALNTYTEPFLGMRASDQRAIIEELLGITMLSQKAETLKEKIKETKDNIKEEEYRIQSIQNSNKKIQDMIKRSELKSKEWEKKHEKRIQELEQAIQELDHIDINDELQKHHDLNSYLEFEKTKKHLENELNKLEKTILNKNQELEKTEKELKDAREHQCPTCGQEIHDKNHEQIIENLKQKMNNLTEEIQDQGEVYEKTLNDFEEIKNEFNKFSEKPQPFYNDINQAYNHRTTYEQLKNDLEKEKNEVNPEKDNIEHLKNQGLQEISYQHMNNLVNYKDHQDFLLKLLVNKDSFIRKKIIDQNLAYLNKHLNNYLEKLALPHEVVFQNDLTVEITELGRELDFDNLSRGEKNRLILGLSWAFRDLWESLNESINVMFIDEVVDSGMDGQGVENALEVLKKSSRERNKSVFLISHREELMSRVSNVLVIQKENGFTEITENIEE